LFLGRPIGERRNVERDLAALAKPLSAVLEARRELRDAETTLNAITAAERERGRSLAVLSAVTGALPDSSVLTSFAWSGDGSGVLVGAARHAPMSWRDSIGSAASRGFVLAGPRCESRLQGGSGSGLRSFLEEKGDEGGGT